MTGREFISALSAEWGRSQKETAKLMEVIAGVMADELVQGNSIVVKDFGTFEVRKKEERLSVIPSTQQRILVPPKLVLAFKPAVTLKTKLK